MLTSAFIRREIDAINEKWCEIQKGSERKGEGLAIFYRLHRTVQLSFGLCRTTLLVCAVIAVI
jgi:hypothetical protein